MPAPQQAYGVLRRGTITDAASRMSMIEAARHLNV
jgi:hypothetical protein